MSDARFKQHFDMISLNEPVTRKAKFWQSYVRALKGQDDMRAEDSLARRPRPRLLSEFPSFIRSPIFDDLNPYSGDPHTRIFAPGYRYLPVSRETYGYSPRNLSGLDRPSNYRPRPDLRAGSVPPRASSVPPFDLDSFRGSSVPRGRSVSPFRAPSVPPFRASSPIRGSSPIRASSVPPQADSDLPYWYTHNPRAYYPYASRYPLSYWRPSSWDTSDTPTARPYLGDLYSPGGYRYRPYLDMLEPSPYLPVTAVTRNPWWYDAYGLKPISYIPRSVLTYPSALRNSYLSPVRNNYVWSRHPLRPL